MELPKKIQETINQLGRIPGVGNKTALRQTLFLANWAEDSLYKFSDAIRELAHLKKCHICGILSDENTCGICLSDERKASKSICVVESISDCMAIESSNTFFGTYHILGGVLNPLLGIGPDDLRVSDLISRIEKDSILEIILAVNPSVEGDATCSYINQLISKDITAERIGFGIPMGGSLEYLDSMTISKALENRKKM